MGWRCGWSLASCARAQRPPPSMAAPAATAIQRPLSTWIQSDTAAGEPPAGLACRHQPAGEHRAAPASAIQIPERSRRRRQRAARARLVDDVDEHDASATAPTAAIALPAARLDPDAGAERARRASTGATTPTRARAERDVRALQLLPARRRDRRRQRRRHPARQLAEQARVAAEPPAAAEHLQDLVRDPDLVPRPEQRQQRDDRARPARRCARYAGLLAPWPQLSSVRGRTISLTRRLDAWLSPWHSDVKSANEALTARSDPLLSISSALALALRECQIRAEVSVSTSSPSPQRRSPE